MATTGAAVADVEMTGPIQDGLAAAGLAPAGHFADAGYTSAALLLAARARGITLTGLVQAGTRGQAPGYTLAAFTIDWDRQQATCPQGATTSNWRPVTQHGTPKITVKFPAATCQACPARPQCTPTTQACRSLSLHPRDLHETLQQARTAQATQTWKDRYKIRAGAGRHHLAGHPHHRHPHRPLPRPGQNPPAAPRRRRSHQPHPPRRLGPATHPAAPAPAPPHPAQPHPHPTPISQQDQHLPKTARNRGM